MNDSFIKSICSHNNGNGWYICDIDSCDYLFHKCNKLCLKSLDQDGLPSIESIIKDVRFEYLTADSKVIISNDIFSSDFILESYVNGVYYYKYNVVHSEITPHNTKYIRLCFYSDMNIEAYFLLEFIYQNYKKNIVKTFYIANIRDRRCCFHRRINASNS